MNRKDVNNILSLLPLSSSIIGAPRNTAKMIEFVKNKPLAGTVFFNIAPEICSNIPPSFFKSHKTDIHKSIFAVRLKSARVWGRNGAVIAADDYFINDVSREFNKGMRVEHSIYYTIKQAKKKIIDGDTAVIGTAGANIYYHWMLDILPRLEIISKVASLKSINYFITEFTRLPFQVQTLAMVGIPLDKIIASNDNWNFHVKAEKLIVPSLAGSLDQPNNLQINFLRALYKDHIKIENKFRKLYISRNRVARRLIVNEDELITCLAKYQFEFIQCEDLQVAEQVKLFSEAAVIICSHGSALTNLVFCQEGVEVLDIFNEAHINPCFWFISQIRKLRYHFITGKSVPIDGNPKNDNTQININDLKEALQKMQLPD